MNRIALTVSALLMTMAVAHAADIKRGNTASPVSPNAGTATPAPAPTPAPPAPHVTTQPAVQPVTQPLPTLPACPSGYQFNTQGVDVSKGEFYCAKISASCPAGYTGNVNSSNGMLICTPSAPPSCPIGWTGNIGEGGKLICAPVPQPKIFCPDSPLKAEGYYLQYYISGWSVMGCNAFKNAK